jgi:hypothetical protein
MVGNLAAQDRVDEAPVLQRQMEPQVLAWLGAELYTTEAATVRRQLVASQSSYQDVALSLALLPGAGTSARELAASTLFRFKSLAVEEEAYLARLERRSQDSRVRAVAAEIKKLHQQLAKLFQGGGIATVPARQPTAKDRATRVTRLPPNGLQVGFGSAGERAHNAIGRQGAGPRAHQPRLRPLPAGQERESWETGVGPAC